MNETKSLQHHGPKSDLDGRTASSDSQQYKKLSSGLKERVVPTLLDLSLEQCGCERWRQPFQLSDHNGKPTAWRAVMILIIMLDQVISNNLFD